MCIRESKTVFNRQQGLSLIELVIFMVIVGVAMAGVIASINYNVQHSADPVAKKQALAIAEALLEEIELMPFTWCDPDDANIDTASNYTECAALSENNTAPEPGETRSGLTPFDNVNDYNDYCMATPGCSVASIRDITGAIIPELDGYTASVAVAASDLGPVDSSIALASGAALHITVTVTGPLDTTVVLESYRTRYTPQESM